MKTKRIPLGTHGKWYEGVPYALVDDGDYRMLSRWSWHLNAHGYAVRQTKATGGRMANVLMHRVVNQTPAGMHTDHINRNRLDNRRSNLRTCTLTENLANRKVQSNNTSGYKGVVKTGPNWEARIKVNGVQKYLGKFADVVEAAEAYNRAASKQYGEFAMLNKVKEC